MAKELSTKIPDLYRGIVVDNKDPQHLGRCKVRVPSIHGDFDESDREYLIENLPWALPITPMSINSKRGSFCIPDVNDYVWVMFECSEKVRPVYFGGFYAKSDIPIDESKVKLYIDEDNSIEYDRNNKAFRLNAGSSEILITSKGIEIKGDVIKVSGELKVSEDVEMADDLHVSDKIYCKELLQTGGVYTDIDFSGMTQNQMDDTLESLGIDGLTDYLYIAQQFMGYNEADGSADIFTNSLGLGASSVTPWCASFVSYCLAQAGISGLRSAGVSGLRSQAQSLGLYHEKSGYTPKPGDIFIEKSDGASHTGFVKEVFADGTYTTIEGNSSNMVKSNKKNINSSKLSGFISINN